MRRLILVYAAAVLCLASLAPSAARAQPYGDPSSLVDYWYRTYLGRPADSGLTYWVNMLRTQPADQVLAGILGSEEYYARAGRAPEGFITQLYVDLLKRRPSPAELDFWIRRLYTEDRTSVADEMLTQNPGVWVGTGVGARPGVDVTPGVIVTPRIEYDRYRDWDRDRYGDRHREIYDYRRPYYPYHRGDEHHRDEHHREEHRR
jgi:hypothetical protein